MKALVRFGIAATLLALAPSALMAQDIVTPTGNTVGAVGPAQLKDFSLSGQVVRRAEPAQERSQPAPAPAQQPQRAQAAPAATTASPPRRDPAPAREAASRTAQRPADSAPSTSAAAAPVRAPAPSSVTQAAALDLPPPSPADPLFSPLPAAERAPSAEPSPLASAQTLPWDDGFSPLPWIVALLLAGGAAALYFRRQRSGLAFAGPGSELDEPAPQQPLRRAPARPASSPAPAPSPASAPQAARPVGIVSTRLRPWLELQLSPDRLALEKDRATLEFEVTVFNSGSGPARDVLVEGLMFNAGPEQEREIGAFFANPVGKGERVALIEPLGSLRLRSAVSLPRDQLRQFKAGDQIVFVPIIAFNALYRWSGGECQTSSCAIIGRQTNGEKLAPFRFEPDARLFTGLGARDLDQTVRK